MMNMTIRCLASYWDNLGLHIQIVKFSDSVVYFCYLLVSQSCHSGQSQDLLQIVYI